MFSVQRAEGEDSVRHRSGGSSLLYNHTWLCRTNTSNRGNAERRPLQVWLKHEIGRASGATELRSSSRRRKPYHGSLAPLLWPKPAETAQVRGLSTVAPRVAVGSSQMRMLHGGEGSNARWQWARRQNCKCIRFAAQRTQARWIWRARQKPQASRSAKCAICSPSVKGRPREGAGSPLPEDLHNGWAHATKLLGLIAKVQQQAEAKLSEDEEATGKAM